MPFLFEMDLGTESLTVLANKIINYLRLADMTAIKVLGHARPNSLNEIQGNPSDECRWEESSAKVDARLPRSGVSLRPGKIAA